MVNLSEIQTLTELTLQPVTAPLIGDVSPPGSKSITNRVLLLASLAHGTSRITGALKSLDTTLMARALQQMGVEISEPDATTFVVKSTGVLHPPKEPLMLGNAGTAMRFLTATAALVDGKTVVDGDEDMRKRPIGPLVQAMQSIGITCEDTNGYPPVTVTGQGSFGTGHVQIDAGLSSQYVSALLMAAPRSEAPMEVALTGTEIGARGYIDLTLAAMAHFGGLIMEISPQSWGVMPTGYVASDIQIEPDASAATYLWAAEALTGGTINIGTAPDDFTQPDAKAHALINQFPNMPAEINGSQMQDAVPTLAVLAAFNATPVRFTGIANLRVKECDRIKALSTELNRIRPGLAEEQGDDLIVHSDPTLAGQTLPTRIETYADHRIAMSFALAGLKIGGITILDPACTGKTYPEYWQALASLGVKLT